MLLRTVCACAADAASASTANPKMARTFFVSLLLFLRRRSRRSRQTFFRDDLHCILYGNLGDAGTLVDPFEFLVGLGVRLQFVAPILLRVGSVPGDALQPWFRRKLTVVRAKRRAGRRRRRIVRSRKLQRETENVDAHEQGGDDSQTQGKKIAVDGTSLDVAFLEGDVGVARLARVVTLIVRLNAHGAPGSPQDLGRQSAKAGTASD